MILNNKDYEKYRKIVRTQNIIRVSKIFLLFMVLALTIITVYNFDLDFNLNDVIQTDNKITHTDGGPECSNLSFQETAICLNDYVREIFIYNLTDDSIDLTLDDLKRRGGDCRDWTNFYEQNMHSYGYNNTQVVKMLIDKEEREGKTVRIYHVFLVATHSSGYCNMDMRDLECYQFVNNRGVVKD